MLLKGALVTAMMLIATGAMAQPAKTKMRICAGSETGNYFFAANEIGKRLANHFDVEVLKTRGSLHNLRLLMSNECDVAFAQSDVADLFRLENPASLSSLQTMRNVYSEYVHIICPVASGWSRITHVGKNRGKMMVGAEGSGSAETWRALRKADEKLYNSVERIPEQGIPALGMVKDSKDTCMVWVSGLNSADMQAANLMSVNTRDRKPSLTLIDVDDRDMKKIEGSDGNPMYRFEEIRRKESRSGQPGLYENLMKSSSVEVPVVDALLIARRDYYQAIRPQMGAVTIAVEDASPTIWNRVNPAQ